MISTFQASTKNKANDFRIGTSKKRLEKMDRNMTVLILQNSKMNKVEQGSRYNSGQAPRVVDAARANRHNYFLNGPLGPRVSL